MNWLRLRRRAQLDSYLEAWRFWKVDQDETGLCLRSMVVPQNWPKGELLRATCQREKGMTNGCFHKPEAEIPVLDGSCGIYGFSTTVAAQSTTFPEDYMRGKLIGQVALAGKAIDCELGYRAQYGYPLRIVAAGCTTGHIISLNQARLVERGIGERTSPEEDSRFSIVCPKHLRGRRVAEFNWVEMLTRQYGISRGQLSDYLLR